MARALAREIPLAHAFTFVTWSSAKADVHFYSMLQDSKSRFPTWAVVLVAALAPLVIGFGFLVIFDILNPPISPAQVQSDPSLGQRIASTNDALVFLHAGAQFAFVVAGGVLAPRRMLSLLIAAPISGLAFLVSVVGLIAG
jgi:hypothetical protein